VLADEIAELRHEDLLLVKQCDTLEGAFLDDGALHGIAGPGRYKADDRHVARWDHWWSVRTAAVNSDTAPASSFSIQ
jgi:hypothetical protein